MLKLVICSILRFLADNERVVSHQKLINSWLVKGLMNPYILCKISSFQSLSKTRPEGEQERFGRDRLKSFNRRGPSFWASHSGQTG